MATTFNPIDPSTADIASIAADLLGPDLTLVPGSVSYQGAVGQASIFSGAGATLGIDSGLLLTSGNGTPATSNTVNGFSSITGSGSDADLVAAASGIASSVNDANTVSFKVVATEAKFVTFSFVFGSEEFPEFSSQFSDIAAIFVNGVNIAKFANGNALAVIDDNLTAGNFQDNQDGHLAIEYDGISTKLSVTVGLQDGENTIKLGVGDTEDSDGDSGFFVGAIEANPVVNRPGTQDGSASTNDTLTGPAYHNTFFIADEGTSGHDRITNFAKDDVFATSKALFDSNGDGIITFGNNTVLDLDGPDAGIDTVSFDGLDAKKGLRFLGEGGEGVFVYADATVRPLKALEGKLGDDALAGDNPDAKADTFFFDTALDLNLGHDKITNFGAKDILVTTTKLFDSNADDIVDFGSNHLLDLSGGIGGPGDPGALGEGGTVEIKNTTGQAVTKLEFDGQIDQGGVHYYVYSTVGSAAGAEGLASACPVIDRPGTQDGSASTDDTLTGPAYHNTFFVAEEGTSGHDRITNFAKDDVFATSKALYDSNNDGIITFGTNKVLDLDGPDAGVDTVSFDGLDAKKGLRFLGEGCEDVFVYATATVRPKGALEGKLGDDALAGDNPDAKANTFFFDTALDLNLGHDKITNFGAKDILVTTTKLFDSNNDGRIDFGPNNILDLSGGLGGPGDPGSLGEVGDIAIKNTGGAAVTSLEFDGLVAHGGVNYFVYSLVGSVGTDTGDLVLV